MDETKKFIEKLPHRLKVKTIMYIFKNSYEKIPYLNMQTEAFLGWICPLLR